MTARGEIDFGIELRGHDRLSRSTPASRSRCWPACIRDATSCSRTSRIRTITDLKGKSVGVLALGSGPHVFLAAHGGLRRARPRQGHQLGHQPVPAANGAVRRGQDRCVPRLSARAAGAARPEDRPRDPQQRGRPSMVAVLLLPADGQHGLRPASIRSRPSASCAPSSRRPTSAPPSRRRGRAASGRWRVHRELRLCAPDAERGPLRRVARVRSRRTRCGSMRCGCTRPA